MQATDSTAGENSLFDSILFDDTFRPAEPREMDELGVSPVLIESMLIIFLLLTGSGTGRAIAEHLCVPFALLEKMLQSLRARQILVHCGSAPLNDYRYSLTEQGAVMARSAKEAVGHPGPVPVPLDDYVISVDAQTIRAESPHHSDLEAAFEDISINSELFESLGPAINSGAGLFLYGAPGNGKTTIARRITRCFGQHIWIPQTIIDDGQIIKLFDAAVHHLVEESNASALLASSYDRRWVKVRRPTVIVGGELTMDNLELRAASTGSVSEAPLQLKSNCGCLLIDDFGRQRIEPSELLNRWIVPLENRCDYLTLATGKKIQVPFEQLIIFSTNLEPEDLADEAFLRRIPYKIEVGDPDRYEFHRLFQLACTSMECQYEEEVVDYLVDSHYLPQGRCLRRCHPRDLLTQVRNYCVYNDTPIELRPEYFDRVVRSYFTSACHSTESS